MVSDEAAVGSPADQEVSALARDVISLARATLVVDLRFLDGALSELTPADVPDATFGTDGRHLTYGPRFLLDSYKEERTRPARLYLHTLFHCIFAHPFSNT